jgi:serine/threonine-protein kinase HipA
MGQEAALELVQRIVFNFGIGNGDMHSKNWSVIYRDGRTPSLAPAYDYLSTVVYIPNDDLGMNFADTQAFAQIDEGALQRYARRISMPRKPVVDAALEMVEKMKAAWPTAREAFELPRKQIDEIEQHMNSVPLFSGKHTQFAISLANAKARVAAKTSAAGEPLKVN